MAQSPKDVSTLARALGLEIDKVSHHLRPLRELGLVEVRALKKARIYRLSDRVDVDRREGMVHLTVPCIHGERVAIQISIKASRSSRMTASVPPSGSKPRAG